MGLIGFQILRLKCNDRVKPLPPTTFLRQLIHVPSYRRVRRGRDHMVVGFTTTLPMQSVPITTYAVSSNPTHGEVYSIQHYVIKFVSDLWQVTGFLRVLWFPQTIKLTTTI